MEKNRSVKHIEMGQYPESKQQKIFIYTCLVQSCNAVCNGEEEVNVHTKSTGHCSFNKE